MLYLVAYDITEPKRLRRVARTCEDYGIRIEYSVFECDLSRKKFEEFWKELNSLIDKSEDSLIAYSLCSECERKIQTSGVVKRPELKNQFLYIL